MDYNIEHYTIQDLEEMFNLSQPYSTMDVYEKETIMKNKVFSECGYSTKYSDMSEFISNAINKILCSLPPTKNEIIGNDLILQPTIPTLHTQEKPYIKGSLNELAINTITRTLTINSKFRTEYKDSSISTNFNIELPYPIKQVTTLTLESVTIPFFSYYSIDTDSNYFLISINTSTFYQTFVVTIDVGNYTPDEFVSALNTAMISIESHFSVTLNSISNRMTISNSMYDFTLNFFSPSYVTADPATGIFPIIPYNYPKLGIGWKMGYRQTIYNTTNSYTSETVVNLFGEYIYLILNDYVNNIVNENIGMLSESYLDKNILAKLPINNPKNNNLSWENKNIINIRNYFGPVDIKKINVQLMDEYGRIINLNQSDWSFTLVLTCLYSEL